MKIIKYLLVTLLTLSFIGCSESKILEENTKEDSLSKFVLSYRSLNPNIKEGYLFKPLYTKNGEIYGFGDYYYKTYSPEEEQEELMIKVNKDGNFEEYYNYSLENYMNDFQVRTEIKDKNIYTRSSHIDDINYFYADFENDKLKELKWIAPYMNEINIKKKEISNNYDKFLVESIFTNDNGVLYEVNTEAFYKDYSEANEENHKLLYYIDLIKEEVFISEIYKEEPAIIYYYNKEEKAFIKVNIDGTYEKVNLNKGEINLKDYNPKIEVDLKEIFSRAKGITPPHFFNEERSKDYSIIRYSDENVLYKYLVIKNDTNEIKVVGENYFEDDNYIYIKKVFQNSNYFLTIDKNKNSYIGRINEDLDFELIGNINLNLDLYSYSEGVEPQIDIFFDNKIDKGIITIKEFNADLKDKISYLNIQYILVEIDEKE